MPPSPLRDPTISGIAAALERGETTSAELVGACLARIRTDLEGGSPVAVAALCPDASRRARRIDTLAEARGPLHGVPIIVKDNIDVAGMPTAAGSILLADNVARIDAPAVRRLRAAGAVIVGKATLHELSSGITGVSALHGPVPNARNRDHVAGGSSAGSAVAVALGYVPAAIGTDTAGSIRIPASFHGLVGLRATAQGRNLEGVVPLSPTQDVVGPIARTPGDGAVILDVLDGRRGDDRIARRLMPTKLRSARIGVPTSLFGTEPGEAPVSALAEDSLREMQRCGATLVPLEARGLDTLARDGNTIDFEFAEEFERYLRGRPAVPVRTLAELIERDVHHRDLDETLRRRCLSPGTNSAAYLKAAQARSRLRAKLQTFFHDADLAAIAYPTTRCPAARIGQGQGGWQNVFLSTSSGFPAVTVPIGTVADELRVGLDLLGMPGTEAALLSLAAGWQEIAPGHFDV